MLAKKRKKIHLVFKSHHPNEPYALQGMPFPETKTTIFEASSGVPRGTSKRYIATLAARARGMELGRNISEMLQYVGGRQKGKRVIAGESGKPHQFAKLKAIDAALDRVEARFRKNPSFDNYLNALALNARHMRYRHLLIRNTIRRQSKSGDPLVANYGYAHSLLSAELRSRGVDSSRSITAREFNPHETVLRKLVHGRKLKELSQKELQEGYLSELFFAPLAQQLFGQGGIGSDVHMRFHSIVMHALLRGIMPHERGSLVLSPTLDALLRLNSIKSLDDPAFEKMLLKNSPFYRRMAMRQKK